MGGVISKICACLFFCCPERNCWDRKERETKVIYNQIRQLDDCFTMDEFV